MRVLIYGAGVIGSLYAALISEAGADVSLYARGNRLKELQMYGLRYKKIMRFGLPKYPFYLDCCP